MKTLAVALSLLATGCSGSLAGPSAVLGPEEIAVWARLMTDLGAAGMDGADPVNLRGLRLVVGGTREEAHSNDHMIQVPAPIDPRLLRHEMAHFFCEKTLGHGCANPGNTVAGHRWKTPSGRDLWEIVD